MNKELQAAIKTDEQIEKAINRGVLVGYRGSVAHNTQDEETDDIDILGIFISTKEHYFGLTRWEGVERVGVADKYDFALYEIQKFIGLLLKSNPNVLSLLWLPENLYIIRKPIGDILIKNRDKFISKYVYNSFSGYAYGQLKRMTHCCTKQAYQGQKRRERFEKFGYDCKNAAHLIRLLRMGIETLSTGELFVERHDAPELKEIKLGEWTLERVEREANRLKSLMEEALVKSTLPARPDYKFAEQMLIYILSENL